MVKTRNENLQKALEAWAEGAAAAFSLTNPSRDRTDAILAFCQTFVPLDTTEDDISYFSGNLNSDDEFFEALCRELHQCAVGELVEKVEGDQKKKAIYTLLPPQGTVSEGFSLDIVRELTFISGDSGLTWRAEVSAKLLDTKAGDKFQQTNLSQG